MQALVGETYWRRLVFFYIPLFMFLTFLMFPFFWMFVASVKPDREMYDLSLSPYWVHEPTLEHWTFLFTKTYFLLWTFNTLLIAIGSTALSLFCGVLAGYALARLSFLGSTTMGIFIFVTYLVPPSLLFIPLSDIISGLNMMDSRWSLILAYPTILAPFCAWLLMGYFKTIPRELEDCARVDGATWVQAFVKIILPLATPGILSAGIFAFTLSWNEFLYALVFLSSPENKTVPVGVVTSLVVSDIYNWGALMSGALFGSIPVAIVYSFFVEYYVTGMTGGAVKG